MAAQLEAAEATAARRRRMDAVLAGAERLRGRIFVPDPTTTTTTMTTTTMTGDAVVAAAATTVAAAATSASDRLDAIGQQMQAAIASSEAAEAAASSLPQPKRVRCRTKGPPEWLYRH